MNKPNMIKMLLIKFLAIFHKIVGNLFVKQEK